MIEIMFIEGLAGSLSGILIIMIGKFITGKTINSFLRSSRIGEADVSKYEKMSEDEKHSCRESMMLSHGFVYSEYFPMIIISAMALVIGASKIVYGIFIMAISLL